MDAHVRSDDDTKMANNAPDPKPTPKPRSRARFNASGRSLGDFTARHFMVVAEELECRKRDSDDSFAATVARRLGQDRTWTDG